MRTFRVCMAFTVLTAALAFGQAAGGQGGGANAAVQRALATVAGMSADLSSLQEENRRLNGRVEELEASNAAMERRLEELRRLCVSLNERLQTQERDTQERLKAFQTAIEADQRQRREEAAKLTQDLKKLLGNGGGAPKTPPRPAYSGKVFDYTVASGDTLSTIAKAAGVTVKEIMELNGLKSADVLRVGQVLQIPDKSKK